MKKTLYLGIAALVAFLLLTQYLLAGNQKLKEQSASEAQTITPIECTGTPTAEVTEGPYYKEGSPEKSQLDEQGALGTKLTITGYVYDTNCHPITNAWLDFWQADGDGTYDTNGYTLRGHQFTDSNGKYTL